MVILVTSAGVAPAPSSAVRRFANAGRDQLALGVDRDLAGDEDHASTGGDHHLGVGRRFE